MEWDSYALGDRYSITTFKSIFMKYISASLVFAFLVFATTGMLYWNSQEKRRLHNEIDALHRMVESRDSALSVCRDNAKVIEEELEYRESEIGYWGRLYEFMKEKHPGTAKEAVKQINKIYGIEENDKRED